MGKKSEHSIRENVQMANKQRRGFSTSFVMRKLQIKTMKYPYIPVRMSKTQKADNTNCW